jgi:hypothetical protein
VNIDRQSLVLTALAVGALGLATAWSMATARAQEPPSIAITAPAEGETLPGPDLTVQIAVSGFDLRPPLQEGREPNAGHIEYFLDVQPTFDQPAPLGEDAVIHSGRFSETFAGVPPGEHTVFVCLAYDDHTCIDPSLTDSAQVTVGQAPPTAEPTLTPEPTPEPPPPTLEPPSPTPTPPTLGPPSPTPTPPTPTPTEEPGLDGMTEETPSPTATATCSPTPRPTPPGLEPTSTPMAGLAPSTLADSGNARSVDWALALACASIVGLVAMGWLTLLGVRRPIGKRQ